MFPSLSGKLEAVQSVLSDARRASMPVLSLSQTSNYIFGRRKGEAGTSMAVHGSVQLHQSSSTKSSTRPVTDLVVVSPSRVQKIRAWGLLGDSSSFIPSCFRHFELVSWLASGCLWHWSSIAWAIACGSNMQCSQLSSCRGLVFWGTFLMRPNTVLYY